MTFLGPRSLYSIYLYFWKPILLFFKHFVQCLKKHFLNIFQSCFLNLFLISGYTFKSSNELYYVLELRRLQTMLILDTMASPFKLPFVLDLTCLDCDKYSKESKLQYLFPFQLQVVIGGMIKPG